LTKDRCPLASFDVSNTTTSPKVPMASLLPSALNATAVIAASGLLGLVNAVVAASHRPWTAMGVLSRAVALFCSVLSPG